ncbi:MAG: cellulase family glycosylhydrolase [Flavisolibacter sp.]|nr:cellulase family glycosylhydrolase [Flavisolibacter sp.]
MEEAGNNWTPIGQNDAITWPELKGLFRRKDIKSVEDYLTYLKAHGVTCLRLMLEYCQTENRYIERPAGTFQPNMVKLWDDLFALCEKHGLRILLTPFDTFWMWIRWKHHPYNKRNSGPCAQRSQWLLCPQTLNAIKGRLTFAARRWGGSGVLFGWDLWNEIHPSHAENNIDVFYKFVSEISSHLRKVETELYGRSHLQTVSLFGPVLQEHPAVADIIFRHPMLDFATTHFYDAKTINHPKDTVAPAICTGALVREALGHLSIDRPFFDSEHGPIHAFKDLHRTLPESFDDEYFRHIQWAHIASGGAGGGMRWPNRHPHILTKGMREAQHSLSQFLSFINWQSFRRQNLNEEVRLSTPAFATFACGDRQQAIVWLLRQDRLNKKGMIDTEADALPLTVLIPGLEEGTFNIFFWNTITGEMKKAVIEKVGFGELLIDVPPVKKDVAIAVVKINEK